MKLWPGFYHKRCLEVFGKCCLQEDSARSNCPFGSCRIVEPRNGGGFEQEVTETTEDEEDQVTDQSERLALPMTPPGDGPSIQVSNHAMPTEGNEENEG